MEGAYDTKAFKERKRKVMEETHAFLAASRKVDSEKLNQRFGS